MVAPIIASKSATLRSLNATNNTVAAPSGIVDGDLLLLVIALDGNPTAFVPPTGFTEITPNDGDKAPSDQATLYMAFKIASSESGSYNTTWTTGQHSIAYIYRITGAISGSEIQDPSNTNTGSVSPVVPLSFVTDTDDVLAFALSGIDRDRGNSSEFGTGWTNENYNETGGGSPSCALGVSIKTIGTAGATLDGNRTLTSAEEWVTRQIGIRSIGPAATKIFTIDGILQNTFIKTFLADARLVKQGTKTFLLNARLIIRGTKTFLVDSILKDTLTKTFSLDSILNVVQTKIFTIDAGLAVTTIKTFLIDALLKATLTKTFLADAILQATQTKTFLLDGILSLGTFTKTFSIDSILQQVKQKTFTIDAVLKAQFIKVFGIDGILRNTFTKNFIFDGILKIIQTKNFSFDGILQGRFTKSFSIDANLVPAPGALPVITVIELVSNAITEIDLVSNEITPISLISNDITEINMVSE